MTLSRDDILGASDLPLKEVQVDAWGGETVWLRTISAAERSAYAMSQDDGGGKPDLFNFQARFLVYCLCDADGQRLFNDHEGHLLGGKCAAAIDQLFQEAQKLNALGPAAAENARKNS